ncbi:MAG: 16S rRNA (guanine(966)-N(2))-methyltransferase RsmD [Lachnospiraceae bacterium]|nr:16S rRNA (guanine(966)-N(2))-methyltransferase RsmD [Lachnospiraceae bacterium]
MMRVIAGTARSLKLKTPEGADTRPTTDRIKETLFNMIQMDVPGSIFLDLFSGSGGIGIEALSRGAKHAYFIENAKAAIACIQENLAFTKFADKATLLKQDASGALSLIAEKEVHIIFMDPPYQANLEGMVFATLKEQRYVTENTLIIVEAAIDKEFDFLKDIGFEVVKEKKYKTNKHVFCRKVGENEESNLSGKL